MEDENHAYGTNGENQESPCLKSITSSNDNTDHHHHHHNKEQDRFLPIANVGRIMKKVIPVNGKISKDAKETVQECVSEFISFVTSEASDKCQREKRKTINGDDILWAITTLGFEDYVCPLKRYLEKCRDIEGEKVNVPKQQQRAEQRQVQYEQEQESIDYKNVYSSPALMSQSSFGSTDHHHHHQAFSLPYSPNSLQKLQPQDQVDSIARW